MKAWRVRLLVGTTAIVVVAACTFGGTPEPAPQPKAAASPVAVATPVPSPTTAAARPIVGGALPEARVVVTRLPVAGGPPPQVPIPVAPPTPTRQTAPAIPPAPPTLVLPNPPIAGALNPLPTPIPAPIIPDNRRAGPQQSGENIIPIATIPAIAPLLAPRIATQAAIQVQGGGGGN